MTNLIDYVKTNTNSILEQNQINEIDNMIFARLSYMPFKHIDMCAKKQFKVLQ